MKLLPLNCSRRLRGDVVDDPVDAPHLVDDAPGAERQEFVVEGEGIGGHAVGRGDCTRVKQSWNIAVHRYDSTPSIAPSSTAFLVVLRRRPGQGSSRILGVEDTLNWRRRFHTKDQPPPLWRFCRQLSFLRIMVQRYAGREDC